MLKQEIHRAVQVTLTLGQFAGVTQAADFEPDTAHSSRPARPAPLAANPSSSSSAIRPSAQLSKLFTEQPVASRLASEPQAPRDMSRLGLILSIAIILLTAVGAGFLIMRPLLSDR